MIRRAPGLVIIILAAMPWLLVGLWGWRGHRQADRHRTRADSLATEFAVSQMRELGWETTLAGVTQDLTQRLDDSVSAVLEAARAEPIIAIDARVQVVDTVVIYATRETEDDEVWTARYLDEVLDLSAEVDHPARRLSLGYSVTARGELIGSVMPDGRLLVAVRGSSDDGIMWEVPELAWQPPPPPPGPSRLRWLLGGVALGVVGWELIR